MKCLLLERIETEVTEERYCNSFRDGNEVHSNVSTLVG